MLAFCGLVVSQIFRDVFHFVQVVKWEVVPTTTIVNIVNGPDIRKVYGHVGGVFATGSLDPNIFRG